MMPATFAEYREPFVGGGSVFISLRQRLPRVPVWINDLNYDLYCFWRHVQSEIERLAHAVGEVRTRARDGGRLFSQLVADYDADLSTFERAVRFFVLNRITFSGTVDSGGYSQQAFERRFTPSCVTRLEELRRVLDDVRITNLDYSELLADAGRNVFAYLDPPYLSAVKSKLYGRRGELHVTFDHAEFARMLKACRCRWLVTLDDSPEVRRLFGFANVRSWELQYGMNNYARSFAPKGRELLITNYDVPEGAGDALPETISGVIGAV